MSSAQGGLWVDCRQRARTPTESISLGASAPHRGWSDPHDPGVMISLFLFLFLWSVSINASKHVFRLTVYLQSASCQKDTSSQAWLLRVTRTDSLKVHYNFSSLFNLNPHSGSDKTQVTWAAVQLDTGGRASSLSPNTSTYFLGEDDVLSHLLSRV